MVFEVKYQRIFNYQMKIFAKKTHENVVIKLLKMLDIRSPSGGNSYHLVSKTGYAIATDRFLSDYYPNPIRNLISETFFVVGSERLVQVGAEHC
jgi:hypothetical protein